MKLCQLSILALLAASLSPLVNAQSAPAIVPNPQQMRLIAGKPFTLNPKTTIIYRDENSKTVANLLAETLRPATGLPLPVARIRPKNSRAIVLSTSGKLHKNSTESYSLLASETEILLTASSPRGLFNATQTLLQLLPPEIHNLKKSTRKTWSIPAVSITDAPSFPWRGMMLDPARYFITKKYILRYLDMMALHKLNVLHLHLIDDCGWRIEIKKYPKLTEVGAWRGKGENRHGGFYSQDDIREMVAYARARNITIVPEIEIPAHTLSALVAYPHLGCFNKKFTMPSRHSISPELYCAGKETTWKFLEDVLTEVCDLFPSTFIHIGGDEAKYQRWDKCPDCQALMKKEGLKNAHELQGWMTTRIETILRAKGRRIIGWDEILHCGVSNKAGIMTWHKPSTAVDGAKRGNPVVMSLVRHTYFDTPESKLPGEPPAATWTPPVTLSKAYNWHPVPKGLKGAAAKNILGPNGCVWNDRFLHNADVLADKPGKGTSTSEAYIDYLSLPRMAALAEVGWTHQDKRDFTDFKNRMRSIYKRYDQLAYNYRIPVPDITVKRNSDKSYTLTATCPVAGGIIRYTENGSTPTATSKPLKEPLTLANLSGFRAATFNSTGKRQSLLFQHIDKPNKYAKYGTLVGKWKSGQVGNAKPKEVTFDATGLIDGNGRYTITFLYTSGKFRLDIDGIKVVRNDTVHVDKDIHHGFAGASHKNNTYKINVKNYETGASFKIKAMIYGDQGTDTNGVVLIKKGK